MDLSISASLLLTIFIFSSFEPPVQSAEEWSYDGNTGPEHWSYMVQTCNGKAQSPINIDTTNLVYDEYLADNGFDFHGYHTAENLQLVLGNSGHSVQLLLKGEPRQLTGAGLPGRFNAFQLHFHWGSENWKGSEHAKDAMSYPMEMHIVHHDEIYNISTALTSPNGLAVLGFFFEISEYDNLNFNQFLNYFDDVVYKDSEREIEAFPLDNLLPKDVSHFFRYHGSLTTPGCYESVIWSVFNQPIPISANQMEMFRMLREGEKPDDPRSLDLAHDPKYMSDNFRPLQPLDDRIVYTTAPWQHQMSSWMSGATRLSQSSMSAVLLVCLIANVKYIF